MLFISHWRNAVFCVSFNSLESSFGTFCFQIFTANNNKMFVYSMILWDFQVIGQNTAIWDWASKVWCLYWNLCNITFLSFIGRKDCCLDTRSRQSELSTGNQLWLQTSRLISHAGLSSLCSKQSIERQPEYVPSRGQVIRLL